MLSNDRKADLLSMLLAERLDPNLPVKEAEAIRAFFNDRDGERVKIEFGIDTNVKHLLIAACDNAECLTCGATLCPHFEPMHLHHDGCPACSYCDNCRGLITGPEHDGLCQVCYDTFRASPLETALADDAHEAEAFLDLTNEQDRLDLGLGPA